MVRKFLERHEGFMLTLDDKEAIKNFIEYNRCILPNGCWEYCGAVKDGYGELNISEKKYRVHRLSLYIYKNFDLNSPLLACHKLICSRKDCFNPEHLYAGTKSNNMQDRTKEGKCFNANKTHCPQGHLYSKENTYFLKSGRCCKICIKNSKLK